MCKKIFIAATGQQCGKTSISIALLHLARQHYRRVGFIKPLGPKPTRYCGRWMDQDAALLTRIFHLDSDLSFMSPVVLHHESTRQVLDGKITPESLERRILQAAQALEGRCDLLIVEGAGHGGVGSVVNLNNARIARLLDAPVLMVAEAGIGQVVDNVHLNMALYHQENVDLRLLLINKLFPEKRRYTMEYLQRAFSRHPFPVMAGFDYSPILANPTLRHVAKLLKAPLRGNRKCATRIIHQVHLGAASTQRVVDIMEDATLLIVTSSRNELLVTLASLYNVPEYRNRIAGLVIPGVLPVSQVSQQILDRSHIPYIRTESLSSTEVFSAIDKDVSKINPEDYEKIHLLKSMAEQHLDFSAINDLF